MNHVIPDALSSQQKMIVKTDDKFIQNVVDQNTKEFTRFIQNMIEKENIILQAKIEKEYQKKKYNDISEEDAKKLIREKFQDSARKRAKNIVKDALHTNQSQISWTYNVNNGMKYKVWMNGQGKSRVRPWHVRSKIQPVEIDDFFDIYGPKGHARMMYPGDLNGGAENVANCRCWLHYTNTVPSNLKKKGTIQINPNINLTNENKETFSANTEKKGLFVRIREKIRRNRIAPNRADSTSVDNSVSDTRWNQDYNKVVKWNGKKVYGVGETTHDKLAFQKEYGIKDNELTKQELEFIHFYSREGDRILHKYNRKVNNCNNLIERLKFKRKCSKEWYEKFKDYEGYISFSRALRVSNSVFKKGKHLKEDIVVVRRQNTPMTNFANDEIYHSDSYLSTSISENAHIEKYGPYKNYIVIPKDTKILYIEEVTWTRGDYEILIDKNNDLKIIEEKSEFLVHWEML